GMRTLPRLALASVLTALAAGGCKIGNDLNGTCSPGQSWVCDISASCSPGGPEGGCTFECKGTGTCNFTCEGGNCQTICENTGNCITDCTGGNCTADCRQGTATCLVIGPMDFAATQHDLSSPNDLTSHD